MRFGFDARLNAYRQGGIAQYNRQLLKAMAGHLRADERIVCLEHLRQRDAIVPKQQLERSRLITPPHNRFEQWTLPVEIWPRRLDLLHSPDVILPLRRPCPAVITIHDLAFLYYPEILDDAARRYYSQVRQSAHSAEAVIAVSESTRTDIVNLLDLPPERIDVVYEAADPDFRPIHTNFTINRSINQTELQHQTFILFVSTIEPRKNLETILRALRTIRDRQPRSEYRLVVAGGRGWLDEPIFRLANELNLADAVDFVGKVTQDDLIWLYNACRIYVNPSRYEGFGLPALEALACAAPTLVADTSGLAEIVADAAVKLPTHDIIAWADAIEALWHNPDQREELRRRGPLRAADFSWDRAARMTLAIYRRTTSTD
jgi:glycosyltransferase involved in cell wall biosynthesis